MNSVMTERSDRVDLFLDAAPVGVRRELASMTDLVPVLRTHLAAARSRLPNLKVSITGFLSHLAQRLPSEQPAAALRSVRASDLYLAWACLASHDKAIALFESECVRPAKGALIRMGLSQATRDDVLQQVRQRLFVPDGNKPPKIAQYSGRGALLPWLRAILVRTALNFIRDERSPETSDHDALLVYPTREDSPERQYLKQRFGRDFNEALEAAVSQLSARDRLLLEQHFLDGVSTIKLGELHDVHAVTVQRWINTARATLLDSVQRQVCQALKVSETELASIARLVVSRLSVALIRSA